MSSAVIQIQQVSKSFRVGTQDVQILKNISFDVASGDFLIIFGPSGCGKSTLLHTILGLEPPTSGTIHILSHNIYDNRTEDERGDFRKQHIGMVYQQPNWIKSLTVLENVAFPLALSGIDKAQTLAKASEILKALGMENWVGYIPTELSSGQQQRIALGRALVSNSEIIIADEPTGNLDYESGQSLMQLLTDINKTKEKTIIMVTHDLEYLKFAKTAVKMFNGEVVGLYGENDKDKLLHEVKTKRGNGVNTTIR